ncbi:MAG TPA: hypothetical protein VEQ37_18535 [Actinomycetota bacterium]|nr:hypothetical protein [Actinomycetota bacterium]
MCWADPEELLGRWSRVPRVLRPSAFAPQTPRLHTMFIRYFIEIPRSTADVEAELLDSPGHWSAEPAREAEARGEQLLAEVGFGPRGARIGKRVELQFGEPIRFPSKTILPMSWKPAGLDSLLPRLDADIELGELGPDRTQLSINARYTPPLGSLGRVLNRALLHRVAEATVKDFLDRAARVLARVPAA